MSLTKREEDTLAYVDRTIDSNEGETYSWRNVEVLRMLEDIRSLLLTGAVTPGSEGRE